ncbi:MAG: hypothetical protein LC772_00090 [Chloroflexi bacterium]|nr:hypothetical protein [Chloroflexota bacterium]
MTGSGPTVGQDPGAAHASLRPLRSVCTVFALFACVGGAVLIASDLLPRQIPWLRHAPASAAPLLLIGVAYICLQPIARPSLLELLQRLMLGSAFILWGIDQLLPPGPAAALIGDIVIVLYVLDLSLIIRGHLKTQDWETP